MFRGKFNYSNCYRFTWISIGINKSNRIALVMLSKSNLILDHLENIAHKHKGRVELMVNILEVLPDHCIIAANEQQQAQQRRRKLHKKAIKG